jgi:pilus assembly protein Flp/PilA
MTRTIRAFLRDDAGTTVIEYGLIAALISVAAIAALQAVGGSVDAMFTKAKTALATATV